MNLFAIVKQSDIATRRIRTQQTLQSQLAAEFGRQRDAFIGQSEILDFDPRYRLDNDELFVIRDYKLPDPIESAIRNISQVDDLSLDVDLHIKSIFAAEINHSNSNSVHAYFQRFVQPRLLVSGWTLLQNRDTYVRMHDHGLVLDSSLVAVYEEANGLHFRSYTVVSRFLDLTQYFVEATDDDIREILSDDKFQIDDEAAILNEADSVMRKRFMAVKASGVLDNATVTKVRSQARKFGVELKTNRGKIIFPVEKKEAKALLRFLMEGYYEGLLTGKKYMTNSQKQVGD